MRFHTTLEFAQATSAAQEAYRAYDVLAQPGDDTSPEAEAANKVKGEAFDRVIDFAVVTPTEFLIKLEWMTRRGWIDWSNEDGEAVPAVLAADLRRMQGQAVSPRIATALASWRSIHEPWHLNPSEYDAVDDHHAAFCAVMDQPCTTAGDFMAKAYLNLLGECGSTLHGEAKAYMTGNMFDVDITKANDARDENDAWQRAAYADLDASDLGANLLAYGLPHFSAECWMERADAVGMRVSVITGSEDGRTWFGIHEDLKNEDMPEHVKREQDRLQRIWAFDSKARTALLVDEILREWPQLAMKVVPVPADPVSEKAA